MTDNSIQPSISGLRQKVDRILQQVWTPPTAPVRNLDDTVLIAAVSEFRQLQRLEGSLSRARKDKESRAVFLATERELERLSARWNALFDFIYETPAAGLPGAAAKLRMLTDHAVGVCDHLDDAEATALRDIARVVERELKQRA